MKYSKMRAGGPGSSPSTTGQNPSVGIVQNQDLSTKKKRAMGSLSPLDFYMESLKLAPTGWAFISKGHLVSDIRHSSDWSYSTSACSSPYTRIAGDAGCFIDLYFSSSINLAYAASLSAAMTIRASQRGDVDELTAAKWHSNKVAEGYTRFLLIVMSVTKQIWAGEQDFLSDWDDDGFDIAFNAFKPSTAPPSCFFSPIILFKNTLFKHLYLSVIQGTADVGLGGKLTQEDVIKTVDFCLESLKEEETPTISPPRKVLNCFRQSGHHHPVQRRRRERKSQSRNPQRRWIENLEPHPGEANAPVRRLPQSP